MTDVREDVASTATNDNRANPKGDFIWYELITPDPVGAKAFYDAVVGWTIEAQPSGEMDYRMIGRTDGGMAGGVMRLTDEMASHGARPIWLGYLNVDDVDASVESTRILANHASPFAPRTPIFSPTGCMLIPACRTFTAMRSATDLASISAKS